MSKNDDAGDHHNYHHNLCDVHDHEYVHVDSDGGDGFMMFMIAVVSTLISTNISWHYWSRKVVS